MSRNAKGMSETTRKNKINRLEKHVKLMTFGKHETIQDNGKLVADTRVRYRGGQQALDKLALLKSMN